MKFLTLFICFIFFAGSIQGQKVKELSIEDLQNLIEKNKKPLLVNFWASWCAPCLEEMPYFDSIATAYKIPLIFVSLDAPRAYPELIEKFVKRVKYSANVYW